MAKRRVLGKIVLPFTSQELLKQLKQAMKALDSVIIPTPYSMGDFARLLEKFPLLASPLSVLHPEDCRFFWDTFGVWLIEKRFEAEAKIFRINPSIGPHAHHMDIEVLAFATNHPWPSVIWRDIHCGRCFFLKIFHPTHSFDTQCTKHRCQKWAKQLLNSHTPIEPKCSQFTDIGIKYGQVIGVQSSDDDEEQPLHKAAHAEGDQESVMAWASGHMITYNNDNNENQQLGEASKTSTSSVNKNDTTRRMSISKPLAFLNKFEPDLTVMSKHRKQEHRVKMRKGGKKYSLVETDPNKPTKTLHKSTSSSSDEEVIF